MEKKFDGFVYFREETFEDILRKFHVGDFENFQLIRAEDRKEESGEVAVWCCGIFDINDGESEESSLDRIRNFFIERTADTSETLDIDNYDFT